MGSCLCKGHQVLAASLLLLSFYAEGFILVIWHKICMPPLDNTADPEKLPLSTRELQSGQQHPMEELHSYSEGQPIFKGNNQPYNGSMSDKRSNSGYDIGELATSSLLGLLATIKDHITKPTAMAQGRVAHLIEWKSWGGEATSRGGGWCGWNKDGGGVGATLQEDAQLYSHLTDEIKEARFAAGVAEQFALAEAAMNAWSTQDIENQATAGTIPLQDPEGLYLSQFLLDGGSLGVPQHLYRIHMEVDDTSSLAPSHPPQSHSPSHSHSPLDMQRPPQDQRISPTEGSMRHADSISLSEDEVFYN